MAGLFICLGVLGIGLAIRGRRVQKTGIGRICTVAVGLNCFAWALFVLCLSTSPILGLSASSTWGSVALSAVLVGTMVQVVASALYVADPPMLAAYLHIPAWLYRLLYGESDHQSSSTGA
jgi:hypothetical protein